MTIDIYLTLYSLISDFVLQVSGERSYIAGRNELLSFKDIRCCIIKDEPIHLSITPRPRPEKDIPIKIHVRLHTHTITLFIELYIHRELVREMHDYICLYVCQLLILAIIS